MTVAPEGTLTFVPTAVMTPFANTRVPFAIAGPLTGTMVALRMAVVVLRPVELGIVDCANALDATTSRETASALRILLVSLLLLVLLGLGLFLHQALFLLFPQLLAAFQVLLAVEVDLTLDERRVHPRVDRQRMAVPDDEIGVLAGFDGADAGVETQLPGGVV